MGSGSASFKSQMVGGRELLFAGVFGIRKSLCGPMMLLATLTDRRGTRTASRQPGGMSIGRVRCLCMV